MVFSWKAIGNCKKLFFFFFASIKKHWTHLVGNVSELYDRRRQFYCYVHALTVIFGFTCFYFERRIFFSTCCFYVCFRFQLRPEPWGKSSVACQKCQGQLLYLKSHEYLTSVICWQKEEEPYDVTCEIKSVKVWIALFYMAAMHLKEGERFGK